MYFTQNNHTYKKSNFRNEIDDIIINKKSNDDLINDYLSKGELANYLRERGEKFTFGLLKKIFENAISAKKKRNMYKGSYKFIHRAVPIIIASTTPLIWLVATILGLTRAVNKVIKETFKNPGNNYPNFLKNVIHKTMIIAEGDIKPFLGDDEFYQAFVVSDDLIKILRKELLYEFSDFILNKMLNEPDNKEVPKRYIELELKKWLKNKYNLKSIRL